MASLMCPSCTVVYELEVVPAAMECEYCETLMLPGDQAYMDRIRAETQAEFDEMRRVAGDEPLPPDEARSLVEAMVDAVIVGTLLRGGASAFKGRSAAEVVDEIMRARAERLEGNP